VAAESGEGDVEHLDQLEIALIGLEARVQLVRPRLTERALPEGVEVLGLMPLGQVFAQLVEGHVDEHGRLH